MSLFSLCHCAVQDLSLPFRFQSKSAQAYFFPCRHLLPLYSKLPSASSTLLVYHPSLAILLPYFHTPRRRICILTHQGVIRSYDFTISRGLIAPDGYERDVLLVNGQYPGPLVEANWGDTIQVTLHNNITSPEEGTALHWHGILQKDHPWQDGVPAVTQCPVAPGKKFTYSFIADLCKSTPLRAFLTCILLTITETVHLGITLTTLVNMLVVLSAP